MKRILIGFTGSGGHLTNALTIGQIIKEILPEGRLLFVGYGKGVDRIFQFNGLSYKRIFAKGLQGFGFIHIVEFILAQLVAFVYGFWLVLLTRPYLVISTGGYATAGLVFWSWVYRVPVILQEQNAVPGKVNRFLSPFAKRIVLVFEQSIDYFNCRWKCCVTGPLVKKRRRVSPEEAYRRLGLMVDKKTILFMGGSLGAGGINRLVGGIIAELDPILKEKLQFIHITGFREYERYRNIWDRSGLRCFVSDFVMEMEYVYTITDLAICRAGSATLGELLFYRIPAILVPYPYSRDNHQEKNAVAMERYGWYKVVRERELDIKNILEDIRGFLKLNPGKTDRARFADGNERMKILLKEFL